jgi:hypothetical protein
MTEQEFRNYLAAGIVCDSLWYSLVGYRFNSVLFPPLLDIPSWYKYVAIVNGYSRVVNGIVSYSRSGYYILGLYRSYPLYYDDSGFRTMDKQDAELSYLCDKSSNSWVYTGENPPINGKADCYFTTNRII